jgi:hypothetical protein
LFNVCISSQQGMEPIQGSSVEYSYVPGSSAVNVKFNVNGPTTVFTALLPHLVSFYSYNDHHLTACIVEKFGFK